MSTQEHEAAAEMVVHQFLILDPIHGPLLVGERNHLTRLIAAALADAVRVARADEREACARVAEEHAEHVDFDTFSARETPGGKVQSHMEAPFICNVAEAIRARAAAGDHAHRFITDEDGCVWPCACGAIFGEGDATAKPREIVVESGCCAACYQLVGQCVCDKPREGDATPGPEPDRCKDVHAETGQRCLEVPPHRMSGEYAMHRSASVSWLTLGESQPAAYPCADCGALRTEAQGGKAFTVCDACWDKHYSRATPPKKGRD